MKTRNSRPEIRKRFRGLSLVEVMISLAISAMLLTAVGAAYDASASAVEMNDRFFRASQAARVTMTQLLAQVRRCQALQVTTTKIDVITFDDHDRSYSYDATAQQLKLITNDIPGDPDYVMASNVTSATFTADSEPDPVTQISRVVRVSITLVVKIGEDEVRLSGSAVPRRNLSY